MLILGAHMSIAGGFAQAAQKTGEEFGCHAMQLFTKSPRSRTVKPLDPEDTKLFQSQCQQYQIGYVIAHSSYLLNFGKPLQQIPWALRDIKTDFERLQALGGKGVVVHIGKSLDGDRATALKNVIENAKTVIDQTQNCKTVSAPEGMEYILENTAGQGTEIGFRFEELAQVWKGLHGFSPRLKSCLDTAHLWGAGYDIATATGVKKVLQEYDETIGLSTLSCFHFNDSKKSLGSRLDRHDNIGRGMIGNGPHGLEGLKTIADYAIKNSIPLILETPEKDGMTHLDDIKVVKKMFQ